MRDRERQAGRRVGNDRENGRARLVANIGRAQENSEYVRTLLKKKTA